jgi:hypothetical protein
MAQMLSAEAQIAQREAVVRQIEVDLANTEIRSPVRGTVVQRRSSSASRWPPRLQTPTLFLVAQDLRSMEIYANVDEADVGRVRTGQPVTFTVNAYPGRDFRGEVKLVRLGSQTVQNVVIYTAVIVPEPAHGTAAGHDGDAPDHHRPPRGRGARAQRGAALAAASRRNRRAARRRRLRARRLTPGGEGEAPAGPFAGAPAGRARAQAAAAGRRRRTFAPGLLERLKAEL